MFKFNYKLAIAGLLKQKGNTLINFLGLSAGFVCFLFILLFIKDELSYDKHYENVSRIYRVIHNFDYGDSGENSSSCPFPVGPALMDEYPDMIECYTRMHNWWGETFSIRVEDKIFKEKSFVYADSTFFKVFNYYFIEGNPQTALVGPNKVVITKSAALKYFGSVSDAFGKALKVNDDFTLFVSGIIQDMPSQGHFKFDIIASHATYNQIKGGNVDKWWWCNPAWTYIKFKENIDPNDFEKNLCNFVKKYVPKDQQEQTDFDIQKLTDIHLHSNLDYEIRSNMNISTIYILLVVAIMVILIASINYVNLSTAISILRSKEVGIRKILGSRKKHLITQFLLESFILVFISFTISIILIIVLLPIFNGLTAKEFTFLNMLDAKFIVWTITIILLTGILSGLYPAFYLTSINPLISIRGEKVNVSGKFIVRRLLIIFQFILSILMIFGSVMIIRQLKFMQNKDLNFNKKNIIVLSIKNTPIQNYYQSFTDALNQSPHILHYTFLEYLPGAEFNTYPCYPEGMPEEKERQFFLYSGVDYDFVKTLNIQLVSGRDFSIDYKSDLKTSVLINESMVKRLGWSNENAIGKKLAVIDKSHEERVIGVMKDFNFHSLQEGIAPLIIDLSDNIQQINYILIRFFPEKQSKVIKDIKLVWDKFAQEYPMDYFLFEDHLKTVYKPEEQLSRIAIIFAVVAIILSCMGVFGLFKYTIEREIKFIAIRKVLGSPNLNIIALLVVDFFILITIASVIAFPICWIVISKWLQNYSYATTINIFTILITIAMLIVPPFIIIIQQSIRAARVNPICSLKYE